MFLLTNHMHTISCGYSVVTCSFFYFLLASSVILGHCLGRNMWGMRRPFKPVWVRLKVWSLCSVLIWLPKTLTGCAMLTLTTLTEYRVCSALVPVGTWVLFGNQKSSSESSQHHFHASLKRLFVFRAQAHANSSQWHHNACSNQVDICSHLQLMFSIPNKSIFYQINRRNCQNVGFCWSKNPFWETPTYILHLLFKVSTAAQFEQQRFIWDCCLMKKTSNATLY